MPAPLTRDDMLRHAHAWIEAWNRRDLAAVLAPFAEDAQFRSRIAKDITGSSLIPDKRALEAYWTSALRRISQLRFTLLNVICDVESQTLVVHYVASLNGSETRACEIMRFANGRQIEGEALYGAEA